MILTISRKIPKTLLTCRKRIFSFIKNTFKVHTLITSAFFLSENYFKNVYKNINFFFFSFFYKYITFCENSYFIYYIILLASYTIKIWNNTQFLLVNKFRHTSLKKFIFRTLNLFNSDNYGFGE